ncbi:hypothetical protein A1356_09090 [Methylomonas koyamae]|uniref:Uncharacterized protein n=1 Tax=Methylomonas koyamae TaxID=702114 RepID=A0AA91DDS7_9GAMM|nr:hypothetical protein A1356_09090 [Methylomonas koyamae]
MADSSKVDTGYVSSKFPASPVDSKILPIFARARTGLDRLPAALSRYAPFGIAQPLRCQLDT